MKLLLGLLGLVGMVRSLPARAQDFAEPPTKTSVPDSLALIKGFALAHITEPDGRTHTVYVPAGKPGFVGTLPFYRREEEIRYLGQPWSISVDKVQKMRLYGVYYEHMVVKGKRKHLLAARVANGPVELFNYTEVTQVLPAGVIGAVVAGAILAGTGGEGIASRQWYVRRNGELQKVSRQDFSTQMGEYWTTRLLWRLLRSSTCTMPICSLLCRHTIGAKRRLGRLSNIALHNTQVGGGGARHSKRVMRPASYADASAGVFNRWGRASDGSATGTCAWVSEKCSFEHHFTNAPRHAARSQLRRSFFQRQPRPAPVADCQAPRQV